MVDLKKAFLVKIIGILLAIIAMLIAIAVAQIKLAGMKVKDFWTFVKANETLDKLYLTCLNSTIDNEEMAKYPESYKKLGEMREVLRKQRYVSFIN